jgi:hypothetical protein
MVYWLLVELLPVRLIALVVLVGLGLQFGGVDVFGILMTDVVDPILDALANEVFGSII